MARTARDYVFDVTAGGFSWKAAEGHLREHGFIALRSMFPPEKTDYVVAAVNEVLKRPAMAGGVGFYQKDYAKKLYDPLLLGGPTVDLVVDERVLDLVDSYTGSECIVAEMNMKHDLGVNELYFPMHSDFSAGWTLGKSNPDNVTLTAEDMKRPIAVGAMVYLHNTKEGAFCYCAGTHHLGAPRGTDPSKYPDDERRRITEKLIRVEGQKGDLVLFDDRGFHGPEQPVPVSRTVLIFDYYNVAVFGRMTKTPFPVFLNDLGHLTPRQLRALGLGAGAMIPYSRYHTRKFSGSGHFRRLSRLLDLSFGADKWKRKLRRRLGWVLGRSQPSTGYDV